MGYIGLPVLKTGWATGPVPPQVRPVYAGEARSPAAQMRKNVQAGLRRPPDTRIVERSMATIRVLLAREDLTLGEFVCPPGDARWRTENDIGGGYHVVFPWTPVHIARRSMPAMVATPNHAVLYSPGLRFHRRHLTTVGGCEAGASRWPEPPSSSISSSRTILTTCCPGVSDVSTS